MITQAGIYILGFGIAIPATLVVLITVLTKATAGNNYEVKGNNLFFFYLTALIGWAIAFGIRV